MTGSAALLATDRRTGAGASRSAITPLDWSNADGARGPPNRRGSCHSAARLMTGPTALRLIGRRIQAEASRPLAGIRPDPPQVPPSARTCCPTLP